MTKAKKKTMKIEEPVLPYEATDIDSLPQPKVSTKTPKAVRDAISEAQKGESNGDPQE